MPRSTSTYQSPAAAIHTKDGLGIAVRPDFLQLIYSRPDVAEAVLAHEVRHAAQWGTLHDFPFEYYEVLPACVCTLVLMLMHLSCKRSLPSLIAIGIAAGGLGICIATNHLAEVRYDVWLVLALLSLSFLGTLPRSDADALRNIIFGSIAALLLLVGVRQWIVRLQELDADRGSFEVMTTARDPEATFRMLCWLDSTHHIPWFVPDILLDHPTDDSRIRALYPGRSLEDCHRVDGAVDAAPK